MIECMQMCNRLNLKANSTSASSDTAPRSMPSVVGGAVGSVAAAVAVTVVVVLAVLRKRRFRKGWTSFNIQALTHMCTISTVVYFKYCTHVRLYQEWSKLDHQELLLQTIVLVYEKLAIKS